VDPYGDERWGAQSYVADVVDVGYGYFLSGIADTASAAWDLRHYSVGGYFGDLASGAGIAASGVVGSVGSFASDPLGATGRGLTGFYAQFEDSDTAGQATFAVASLAAAPIASTRVAARAASALRGAGLAVLTTTRTSSIAASAEAAVAESSAMTTVSKVARAGEQLEFDFIPPTAPVATGVFEVGLYRDLAGKLPGYDAHHVGQQIAMKRLNSRV